MSTFRSGDTLHYIWKHVVWCRGKIVLFILLKNTKTGKITSLEISNDYKISDKNVLDSVPLI